MFSNFAFLDLGAPELIIILPIILVLFGGKNLPKLTKNLSNSVRELRKGFSDDLHESKTDDKKETPEKKGWDKSFRRSR